MTPLPSQWFGQKQKDLFSQGPAEKLKEFWLAFLCALVPLCGKRLLIFHRFYALFVCLLGASFALGRQSGIQEVPARDAGVHSEQAVVARLFH